MIFVQLGAGVGDQDPSSKYRDGFTELVKKIDDSMTYIPGSKHLASCLSLLKQRCIVVCGAAVPDLVVLSGIKCMEDVSQMLEEQVAKVVLQSEKTLLEHEKWVTGITKVLQSPEITRKCDNKFNVSNRH